MLVFLFVFLIPIFYIPGIALEVRTPKFLLLFLMIFIFFVIKSKRNNYSIRIQKPLIFILFISAFSIIHSLYYYGNSEVFWFYSQIFFPLLYISLSKKNTAFKNILFYTVLSSILVSGLGILNFYGIALFSVKLNGDFNRGSIISTIGNVNYVSNYLASIVPILIMGILISQKKTLKFFSVISLILSFFTVLIGQTRSVYFALFISLIVMLATGILNKRIRFFLFIKYKQVILVMLAVTVSILLFVFPPGIPDDQKPFDKMFGRVASVVSADFETGSAYQRQLEWQTGMEMFKTSPAIGLGLGSYKLLSTDYQEKFTASEGKYYGHFDKPYEAHSDIVQILSETGIIGMILFVFFILYIFKEGIKRILKGNIIILSYLSVIMVILIHSFTEFPFHAMPSLGIFTFFSAEILIKKKTIELKKWINYLIIFFSISIIYFDLNYFLSTNRYVAGDLGLKKNDYLFSEYNKEPDNLNNLQDYELIEEQYDEIKQIENNYSKINKNKIKNTAENILIEAFFNFKLSNYLNYINYYTIIGLYNSYNDIKKIGLEIDNLNLTEGITYYSTNLTKFRIAPPNLASINSIDKENINYSEIKINYDLYKIICLSLNAPTDYITYHHIGKTAYNVLYLIKTEISKEEYDIWIQWFRYGYERALKMKRLDTYGVNSNWKNVDLEYLIRLEFFSELKPEDMLKTLEDRDKIRKYAMDRNWTFSMDLYRYLKGKTDQYPEIKEKFLEVYKGYSDYYTDNLDMFEEKYNSAKDLKIKMDLKDREYLLSEYFTVMNFISDFEESYK